MILGPNGSGKSTLLQTLSGLVTLNEGSAVYSLHGNNIQENDVFKEVSLSAPYMELIDDFTFEELVDFHFRFKRLMPGISKSDVIEISGLSSRSKNLYKFYSSGMKQRVKLCLSVLSDTSLLLLDEPCSNLDSTAMKWYGDLIARFAMNKTIVVASNNQKEEFDFCDSNILIDDFKRKR